jgi:two-component system response regulator PilR (NtrC family)
VIERAVALEQSPTVLPDSLPSDVREGRTGPAGPGSPPQIAVTPLESLDEGFDLEARGEDFYRHYMALALERAGGVQVKAAEMLGMSFRSFRYYAKKFNLR